ncbi:hypothetical protein QYF36_011338 [Acer negundo]|nr:hypothetical protein QYF36_011338 [Acer negundo]
MSPERRRPTTAKHDVARKAMTNHGSDELKTPTNTWVCEERPASAVGLEQSTRVLLRVCASNHQFITRFITDRTKNKT